MSTSEELLNGQDPDYVSAASSNQAQQKIYEENARNNTAKKIVAIVEKEFSQEIKMKEKEILQIQERLNQCLKTLHFLRYVIVTNFYNRKQCQLLEAAEASKQTRIHPAVKSLLGKSPKFLNCTEPAVPSTSTDPRFLHVDESPASRAKSPTIKAENTDECNGESSARKRTLLAAEEPRQRKMPRYVPPKSDVPESNTQPSRGDRHKVRKRIIVGNMSKWIPPEWRDDCDATHKWTMYVRGDKNVPDISAYVSKVRFLLHPSYSPHDVVEVMSHPFHLSRRGWGEFPVRVQLHFKNALNKPIDIIHNLKLDRTYTGLQMLSSETLVDLWIHVADSRACDENTSKNELVKLPVRHTRLKVELPKDNNNAELVDVEPSTPSRLLENVSEEIQVKGKFIIPEMCPPFDSSADSALVEKSADVAADNAIRKTASNVLFSINIEGLYLDDVCFDIYNDHTYAKDKYAKPRRIVKHGHVTIEHFPNAEDVGAMDSSSADINEKELVGATIMPHKYNGDIQCSSDRQSPTITNAKNTTENKSQMLQESSEHATFQKNDANESSRATDLQNDRIPAEFSENTAKDTTMMTNGFCKPPDAVFDRLKELQTAASANNSHLKPLEISIPPLFASSTGKHILLMKDKILVPIDKKKPNDDVKICEGNSRPAVDDFAKLKLKPESMPQGTSILKKQPFKVKMNTKNTVANKEASVLTLKGANSLLLNMNYSEPALKIADSRDPQYNYSLSDAMRGISSPSSSVGNRESTKSTDEKTTQRTKVTLGKDKHKLQSKEQLYEAVFQSIDHANIADPEAFARFIIRRLPIVTQNARDSEYRRLHPYACCSEDNFFALSIGKQRALEWHRAKMVKSYMRKKLSQNDDRLWSVKEILMWARLHGYTPNRNVFGMSKVDAISTSTKRLPDSAAFTCTEPVAFHKWLQVCQQESSHRLTNNCVDETSETEIDVVTVDKGLCRDVIDRGKDEGDHDDSTVVSSTLTPLELDESLMPLHKFVCNTAQQIGIKIAPEEIVPGVVYCAASRVIMRVIECFVEDLTRSSLARAWEKNSGDKCPEIITPDDVRNALASREEFDIFTNEGLGSQQQLSTMN